MAICKLIAVLIFTSFFYSFSNAQVSLNSTNLTTKDIILIKYEIFFMKNKNRIVKNSLYKTMIHYQHLSYSVIIDDQDNIKINLNAFMDRSRYKLKKYYPKISDCNIVRNKLITNKHGYSVMNTKNNFMVSEKLIYETIKNNIYNLEKFDEKNIKDSINRTKILINIIHPNKANNISCSGKITQVELR